MAETVDLPVAREPVRPIRIMVGRGVLVWGWAGLVGVEADGWLGEEGVGKFGS